MKIKDQLTALKPRARQEILKEMMVEEAVASAALATTLVHECPNGGKDLIAACHCAKLSDELTARINKEFEKESEVKCPRCKGNGRIEMLEHCPECFGNGYAKPHPEHICRFNDGKSNCECFAEGYTKGCYTVATLPTLKLTKKGEKSILKALKEAERGACKEEVIKKP